MLLSENYINYKNYNGIIRQRAEFVIDGSEDGLDVGTVLKRRGFSRRLIIKLKYRENGITLNGRQARTVDKVHTGDTLSAAMDGGENLEPNPQLYVPAVYEDEDVIVYDKPVNMPVHPSAGHHNDTLGNCFACMYPNVTFRPVNRLDKDTSGLCAVAKNAHSAAVLGGNIQKEYLAAVCGVIEHDGSICAPIGRAGESVIRREVRPDGQGRLRTIPW
jgi:23S rRNA pseudouridine1911/1915/1917 synthase